MSKLYIIGNGFDLAHSIPCGFSSFEKYVKKDHFIDHERIGKLYGSRNTSQLWKNYESKLALTPKRIKNSIKRNIDLWRREGNMPRINAYLDLTKVFDSLWGDILNLFQVWIEEEIQPKSPNHLHVCLSKEDYYLSFNYTHTLEKSYGIQAIDKNGVQHICYIHNKANSDAPLRPIVGHGLSPKSIRYRTNVCRGFTKRFFKKHRIALSPEEVINCYEDLLLSTKKKTEDCIDWNKDFFNTIREAQITDVYVLGHSIGLVDIPYFKMIHQLASGASWHVSYHKPFEKELFKKRLASILGKKSSIDLDSLMNLVK